MASVFNRYNNNTGRRSTDEVNSGNKKISASNRAGGANEQQRHWTDIRGSKEVIHMYNWSKFIPYEIRDVLGDYPYSIYDYEIDNASTRSVTTRRVVMNRLLEAAFAILVGLMKGQRTRSMGDLEAIHSQTILWGEAMRGKEAIYYDEFMSLVQKENELHRQREEEAAAKIDTEVLFEAASLAQQTNLSVSESLCRVKKFTSVLDLIDASEVILDAKQRQSQPQQRCPSPPRLLPSSSLIALPSATIKRSGSSEWTPRFDNNNGPWPLARAKNDASSRRRGGGAISMS